MTPLVLCLAHTWQRAARAGKCWDDCGIHGDRPLPAPTNLAGQHLNTGFENLVHKPFEALFAFGPLVVGEPGPAYLDGDEELVVRHAAVLKCWRRVHQVEQAVKAGAEVAVYRVPTPGV